MSTTHQMGFFTGKVYTITGAGSGIARQTTLILAKKGATVYASDVHGAGLEETAKLGILPQLTF